ncbi:hypothetical protein Scep_016710 [Stephania cephalantha]|uniref:Myb/SANT-like domain-containing protein n=1 Tax=Stephania cephalantha TaxID=152367 RepID=A0AAP0INB7_9MAGN
MGDSQVTVENQKKGKGVVKYTTWTSEESNELLKLLVDAATRGWRDTNGAFTKATIEEKILPVLNATLGCEISFLNYKSRWKWFKDRYQGYVELMRCNSGFGWDPVTKKFTASDEIWEEYNTSR